MNTAEVVSHLQGQFGGQMVLYVSDLAKILGKSDKAVANLISRKALPFNVKAIGGLRCVDIFQVANWLVSTEGVAEEAVSSPTPSAPKKRSSKVTSNTSGSDTQLPSMAQQVLSMRHDRLQSLQRMVLDLRDADELLFLQDVIETMANESQGLPARYSVQIRQVRGGKSALRSVTQARAFANVALAEEFLLKSLIRFNSKQPRHLTHVIFEENAVVQFHLIIGVGNWRIAVNKLELMLPGI